MLPFRNAHAKRFLTLNVVIDVADRVYYLPKRFSCCKETPKDPLAVIYCHNLLKTK